MELAKGILRYPCLKYVLALQCCLVITSGFSSNRFPSHVQIIQPQNAMLSFRISSMPPSSLQATVDEGSVESTQTTQSKFVGEFKQIRQSVVSFLKASKFEGAKQLIVGMFEYLEENESLSPNDRLQISEEIDETLQVFFRSAFATKGKALRQRVNVGMELLHMQLSSNDLADPYNDVPKQTLLNALKALTRLKEVRHMEPSGNKMESTDAAFRILQRLVTGAGVRLADAKTMRLYESDFNMVLNAYSNVGRMDMAHRVIALQERTPRAPVLSPVAYSILLKGYGKLGDLNNVEILLANAKASKIEPDLVMVNSLLDAYINCNEWQKAKEIFDCLRSPPQTESQYNVLFYGASDVVIPNKRTYNIIMKGYAAKGLLKESLELASEMERLNLWDPVTTNTLVQAAANAKEFDIVEKILEERTEPASEKRNGRHPNAEAYTSAIDGFAKAGELQNAINLLKTMKLRGVEPNEFTYTCIVGALAREKKIAQAERMIGFMKSAGLQVGAVTYNSLISGLVDKGGALVSSDEFDQYVDGAINVLRKMMKDGVRPTAVTISIIVDAFGKCDQPRLSEAIALVSKLESDAIINANNTRILTSLVQVYGASGDLDGAEVAFRKIRNYDIAAVNAFLNACTQCDKSSAANDAFDRYFRNSASRLRPDVISYSTMIAYEIKKSHVEASKRARNLYEEMKYQRRLKPDNALVDIILKGMIENGKLGGLTSGDVRFVATVLRDAEQLEWREGQLEIRRGAVQRVMTGRIADKWEEEAGLFGLLDDAGPGEMFKRHGWNKVDSGFNLWGAKITEPTAPRRGQRDQFLESKGWNDVDSGFRII